MYYLRIHRVFDDGGYASSGPVAYFYTGSTSLVVPAGLLESGGQYFFEVQAHWCGVCRILTPYKHSFPSTRAGTVTSVLLAP